jgi:alpha-tubulin suppressor-like RCC1 family protein
LRVTQLGDDNVQAAGGGEFTAVLKASGLVYTFGDNAQGQLGDGTTSDRSSPVQVLLPAGGALVAQLAAGYYHCIALLQGGAVIVWGRNDHGELGDGSTTDRPTPVELTALGSDNAYVACLSKNGMLLKQGGALWLWGENDNQQLLDGTTNNRPTPMQVAAAGTDNRHVLGCGVHGILWKNDGSLVGWGYNGQGQLATGGSGGNLVRASETAAIFSLSPSLYRLSAHVCWRAPASCFRPPEPLP